MFDLDHSFMVGDAAYKKGDQRPDKLDAIDPSNSDRLFAENLGIAFYEASPYFGWMKFGIRRMETVRDIIEFQRHISRSSSLCASSLADK